MAVLDYRAPVDTGRETGDDVALPGDSSSGFHVDLGELFEGPFDLLLGLIAKHKLDVTEVALSKVTDEFIAHIKAMGPVWDNASLDQATEFLVVAATLLDLKAARLLPSGEVEDEEDLALLEARDLLVGAVLQQAREEQVAGLEQAVVTVLGVRLRVGQQPGGLEVEQRGRDDEELRGLVEVHVVAERREVGDEIVRDTVQRQLGDVELVLPDQLQEQVERAGEVVEAHGEPRRRLPIHRGDDRPLVKKGHRARTSRASRR